VAGGRPLHITCREEDTGAALHAAFRATRDQRAALPVQALWLLRQGRHARETAALLGVSERSVHLWVAWYRREGLAGVVAHKAAGRGKPAFLTAAQRTALCDHLATGVVHTAQDAVAWVAAEYGVRYERGGMYTLLRRLRARPKVPRPHNPQSTPADQQAWKKGDSPMPCAARAAPSRRG
jgi:transposase